MSNIKPKKLLRDKKDLYELEAAYDEAGTEEERDKIREEIKAYGCEDDAERIHKEMILLFIEEQELRDQFHPYANFLPLMKKKDLLDLALDIKKKGLIHAIVRYHGKIIDGRNRYIACRMVNIEPHFIELDDTIDAFEFVKSMNMRRDLSKFTSAERCEYGLKYLEEEEKRAKERQLKNLKQFQDTDPPSRGNGSESDMIEGEAMKLAAKFAGVSHDTLRKARKIMDVSKKTPEILKKWELAKKGKMAIKHVYEEATGKKSTQESKQEKQEIKSEKNTAKKASKDPDIDTIRNVIDYLASLEIDPYLPILARNLRTRFNFVVKQNETLSSSSLESSTSTKKMEQEHN